MSTLSTVRVARSTDGVAFTVDDHPLIFPSHPSEQYGCEDARAHRFDGEYWTTYTAGFE